MNVGQLFVTLGIKIDKGMDAAQAKLISGLKKLKETTGTLKEKIQAATGYKEFAKNFKDAAQETKGLLGFFARMVTAANMARLAILGLVAGMMKLTMQAAEASEHLFKFSINTGMNTSDLQKWQQQASQAGVEAEEVANSFKELQRKSMEIQLGQGDSGAFQMAGVNWATDAETMMNQVEQMLKSRPAAMGTKLAMDMGLSEEMVSFLRLRSTMKPAEEGLILAPEEIAELKDFSMTFSHSANMAKQALIKLGAMLAPVTLPLLKFFSRLMSMVADFVKYLNSIGKWKNVIIGIAAAITAGVMAAFFPITATILAVGAAIAAILLIIEDVYSYFKGDESVLGDIIDTMKNEWRTVISWMNDEVGNIFQAAWDAFPKLIGWIMENWKYLTGWMGQEIGNVWEGVKSFFGVGSGSGTPTPTTGRPAFAGVNNPLATGDFGGMGTTNQTISIQVDGSKDPKLVAAEIDMRLRRQTSEATYQMPRGE
jgi:hypothetical protein